MTREAAKLYAALTSEHDPSEFIVYGGIGYHYAYNCRTGKQVALGGNSFSDAIDKFEAEIGPYYESRGDWGRAFKNG